MAYQRRNVIHSLLGTLSGPFTKHESLPVKQIMQEQLKALVGERERDDAGLTLPYATSP